MKKHRVLALVLVFMMLMTSVAYGAIPNNSVIIGDKGYSIDYLMDEGNLAEINEAVAANGTNPIYYQLDGVADSFTDVMTGIVASLAELYALPPITYKDATGQITVYDPAFAPEGLTIVSLAPVAVTTTAGTAPVLPAVVTATMSDFTTQEVSVVWSPIDPSSYAAAGAFVVNGSVADTDILAVANVTVNPMPIGAVNKIQTSVFNAIPNLEGEETGISPTNVVLLGTQAKVLAKAVDANGNPVEGAELTFVITSAKTFSEDPVGFMEASYSDYSFKATAAFGNGLTVIKKTTGADGTAMVSMNNTVTLEDEYYGPYSLQEQFYGPIPSPAWFANQAGAATEVKYTVSYDGDAVTQNDSVAFAALVNEDLYTADNVDAYFQGEENSYDYYYGVEVDNIGNNLDFTVYDTNILFPFSQPGGQTLSYFNRYASSNQVSYQGLANNMLKVVGPRVYLFVYDSQFLAGQNGNSGITNDGLTHSVNGLLPNKTNIYTEPLLHIDGSVNYARLTFNSLSLSPGSAVSVYFVPQGGAAPTGALTANTVAYTNFAGSFITPYFYDEAGGATWCKTFFAVPAGTIDVDNVNEFNNYDGAMPFADEDFTVQIPASYQAGTIYVVLQTPGQIDPGMNTGYVLSRIEKNFGTMSQWPDSPVCDTVSLNNFMVWEKETIDYTYERPLSETQKERLFNADPNNNAWGADPNWYYTYEAPAYPQVGNAVIRAYDGNHQVQMAWSAATRTKTIVGDTIWNENEIQIWNGNVRPLAMDAIERGLVGVLNNLGNGVATIDSEVTGYTELHGKINFGKDASGQDIVPLNYLNTLGLDFHAFAQWTPAPIPQPGEQPDPTCLHPVNQQYTMAGQRVAIEATLYDANGNLVQFKNVPITFYVSASGDSTVTARFVDANGVEQHANVAPNTYGEFTVNSNVNGQGFISISAPQVAAAIVQAEAPGYTVKLKDGPVGNQQDLNVDGLTQINFGQASLWYIPEDNDFEATQGPISMTKAIVGNPQFFGIISEVEWPTEDFGTLQYQENCDTNPLTGSVPNLSGGTINIYCNLAEDVDVNDMPLTVTTSEPNKFTVVKVDPTTSTGDNPTDPAGNRPGIQHWYAVSSVTGYQYISVTVSGLQPWSSMYLTLPNGAVINNPGEGIPTGLNVLNISVQWLAKGAIAQLITPATVNVSVSEGTTPVTVKVTDGVNPIPDQTVTFSLNYMTTGTAVIDPDVDPSALPRVEKVKTDADGLATINVVGGELGEVDQVAITVRNEATGTDVKFADGTYTGSQVINWTEPVNPGISASAVTVTDGTDAIPGTPAQGSITYTATFLNVGLGDSVTVDGVTFTKAALYTGVTFTDVNELATLINNLPSVNAVASSSGSTYTVTITAAEVGTAGNSIGLAFNDTGASASPVVVPMSGGTDPVDGIYETAEVTIIGTAAANGNITVTVDGTPYLVAVAAGDTAEQVAAKIAAALSVPGYTVTSAGDVVTFTATVPGDIVPDLTVTIS